jgi:hypothetical protein
MLSILVPCVENVLDDLVSLISFPYIYLHLYVHPRISFFFIFGQMAGMDEIGKNLSPEEISIHIRWSFMK